MHSIKDIDMLVAKMDLLAMRVEHYEKVSAQETLKAMDSHITCEVCGDVEHSGNSCPESQDDLNFINTDDGFRPEHQGWNQRSNNQGGNNYYSSSRLNNQGNNSYALLKDLVYSNGRMIDSINKKLHAHGKMLENINAKLDEFSSVLKNQLSFNKMIETQLTQIVVAIPSYEKDRIPSNPEGTMETANLVTAKYGYALNSWGSYLLDSPFTIKKGDPNILAITCSIGTRTFHNALCDLGSSVNIMPKATYDKLFYTPLAPTSVYLQLADQSIYHLEGVATDLLVKVRSAYVPTDFMILDMGNAKDTPLILGCPFLNIANACICVASR
jgi:hypothetical protein